MGSRLSSSAASAASTAPSMDRGPFIKDVKVWKGEKKDPVPATPLPTVTRSLSSNRTLYTNPDLPTTWAGVRFLFGPVATVLRVKIVPTKGRDRAHPYNPTGPSCTCCYWGPNEKVDLGGFNARMSLGKHLVDEENPGMSFVTGMTTVEERRYDWNTGTFYSWFHFPWSRTMAHPFNIAKPIIVVWLETGHVVTCTEGGTWCPYLMKESDRHKGLMLSFQGCELDVETLDPSMSLTQRLVAGASGYVATIDNSPAMLARREQEARDSDKQRAYKATLDAAAAVAAATAAAAADAAAAAAAQELIEAPIRAAAKLVKDAKDRADFEAAMEAAKEEDF